MLVRIPDLKRKIAAALLFVTAITFVSCASQKDQVSLVNDPDQKPETQMPWNKQEKWETNGAASGSQLANMTDRR